MEHLVGRPTRGGEIITVKMRSQGDDETEIDSHKATVASL